MSAFLYGVVLQCKLDMRSKSLLITCYVVPLLFFALMGGIFTSINPAARETLIQSMTVMGIAMGALIGLPPSLAEIYGSDIKKVYKANGVSMYLGLVAMLLSAFVHLLIMSVILYIVAPIAFDAATPGNPLFYFGMLSIFIVVSLSVGCALGLSVKGQAKLTMISQLLFLPSIMLSGIMFPTDLLPKALESVGKIFPAFWGYKLMTGQSFESGWIAPLAGIFVIATAISGYALTRKAKG